MRRTEGAEAMIYIYGILSGGMGLPLEEVGLRGSSVTSIPYRDISAAVSELPEGRGVDPSEARAHEAVLLALMGGGPVVPMAFGTCAEDEGEVVRLLERGYNAFKGALERLRGVVQADLRVSWGEPIFGDVLNGDGEVAALSLKARRAPDDLALKVELGRRVRTALTEMEKRRLPQVLDRMKGLAVGFKERGVAGADTLLNASFLVEAALQEGFLGAVEGLEKAHEGRLVFHAVAPLPPYSFVDLRVERPDPAALDEARRRLGLGGEVSIAEVRAAFNRLVRSQHPDRGGGREADFEALVKARDALIEYCEHYACPVGLRDVEGQLIVKAAGVRRSGSR